MKKTLLPSIIADLLKSAKGYAKRATQITPAGNRFRTVSLKPVLVKATLVVFSLFFANAAFARNRVSSVAVNTQNKTVTYGTATTLIGYTITVRSNGGFTGTQTTETLKITWPGGLPTGVTTTIDPINGISFTPNGGTQTFNFTINTTNGTPASPTINDWDFKITSSNNNGGTIQSDDGVLTVGKKALTITGGTITASDKPYDGNTNAVVSSSGVTYGGLVGADVVSISTTGTFTPDASVANLKTVTIALAAGGSSANYTLTQPAPSVKASITAIPIIITPSNVTKTYGQTLTNGLVTTGFTTSGGLIAGQTPKITMNYGTAAGTAAAGTYSGAAVASGPAATNGAFNPANYAITYGTPADVIITPATLIVKATNVSTTYGAVLPTYTPTVTVQNGDAVASVIDVSTLVFTTTPATPTNAGTYNITVSGGTVLSSNYSTTITYQNTGTLTITKAPLTIDANDVTKIVGTSSPLGAGYTDFTPTGLQNGETVGSVTVSYNAATRGDRSTDPVGPYNNTIQLAAATGGTFNANNYNITYTKGTITIIAAIYDWTGAVSTFWNVPGNWNVGGVVSTVSPGTGTTDQARIGVAAGITFTNQPDLTANLGHSLTSLTFGSVNGASTLTTDAGLTLTVATLNINASTTATITDNGTVTVNTDYNDFSTSVLNITGAKAFSITSTSGDLDINGAINQQGAGTMVLNSTGGNNDININATGKVTQAATATGAVSMTSNANFNISGSVTQSGGGFFTLTDNGNVLSVFTIQPGGIVTQNSTVASTLSLITTSNITLQNNGTINLQAAGNVTMNSSGYTASQGTISQIGSGAMSFTAGTSLIAGFLGISGFYNNNVITQSGSGTMIFNTSFHNDNYPNPLPAPSVTQTGSGSIVFNNTVMNGGLVIPFVGSFNGGPMKFAGGTSSVTFVAVVTNNTGTIALGTGPSFFTSALINNNSAANSLTFDTGLATFNATNPNLALISIPRNSSLTLVNSFFTNNVIHTFITNGTTGALGSYIIRSDGVMTLSSNTTCDFTGASSLTLNSDATGSASIAALTSTNQLAGLAGKAIVQRFIKGSADVGNTSKRGYRLLSSTVYTATPATAGSDANAGNSFDLKYLLNSGVFVSGTNGAANGFNVTTTNNPTIYLFREDEAPPPSINTTFTTGYNWKAVTNLTGSDLTPSFATGTTQFGNPNNVFDQTVQLPVGNGVLFFFRGGGNDPIANKNYYTAPFANPADGMLTQTGTLNTGDVQVRLWYNYAHGTAFTYTAANVTADQRLSAGYTLVGNPYPSTINWETYNRGGITGNVTTFIYEFNEASKQYGVYEPAFGADVTTEFPDGSLSLNGASNLIASGQGFFVLADVPGETLTFHEAAKVNTQSAPANLLQFMGKPKATAAAPVPILHLAMVKDSVNTDEAFIRFRDNSSLNYVRNEDAPDIIGDGLVNLSILSADSVKLAISTMPLPGLQPSVVRLFTGSPNPGTYTLKVKAIKNMPSLYKVWLKDGFTKDSVDLRKTDSYAFTIDKTNPATFGVHRFTVVFSQDTANAYHLLNFDAQKTANEQKVQTTWTTKNEQNYTNFTVERSTDNGDTFDVVGGMHGTGAGLYSLVDKNPSKGNNVYRLKQEDINNVITYSNLVEVFFGNKNDRIHLYPNPAVNVINVDVRERWHDRDRYEIIVTNSAGAIVRHGTSGDSQWQAGISNLRPGTYLVSVLSKDDKNLVGQAKFVKL